MEEIVKTVIKRDGSKVAFDPAKIINAINKAMDSVDYKKSSFVAFNIADEIECSGSEELTVEEIQDLVESKLIAASSTDPDLVNVSKAYIRYRYDRELARKGNTTDETIQEFLDGDNAYWNTENSNKDPQVNNVQRDYLAGITSTDIARRFILPKEVVKAHDEGLIHVHDMDYLAQKMNNCGLINLEDMLQNGTCINGVYIDPQKRLLTACTVASQICAAVSGMQYGGQTITLSHLAPFVRMSYKIHYEDSIAEIKEALGKEELNEEDLKHVEVIANKKLKKEVRDAVQTFNYQLNSIAGSNGQAAFLSVAMYISEDPEYEKETVMLIEEFLHQRIQGMKNDVGVYVTQAFPKLLYFLDSNNIEPDSEYYWLTKLAAQSTAKRMNPDYISVKKMKEWKINQYGYGDAYGCIN